MASLNLNALKNIPTTEKVEEAIVSASIINSPHAESEESKEVPRTPKISLASFRLDTIKTETAEKEPVPIAVNTAERPIEKMRLFPKANIVPEAIAVSETALITESKPMKEATPAIVEVLPVTSESETSKSIFSNVEPELVEAYLVKEDIASQKELFPGLHLEEDFDFSDNNLLKLEEETEKETSAPIKEIQSIEMPEVITPVLEIIQVATEEPVVLPIEASQAIKETISPVMNESINPIEEPGAITTEYVEQVKTQLSEQRPAGL